MIKFPAAIDDDSSIPVVNDNINEIGGDAINATREGVITLEEQMGIGAPGIMNSLAERLGVAIQPDGHIKPSEITSLGLVTLPVTNLQIADNAGIPESKLRLDYRTSDLFNYIRDLSREINIDTGWISDSGIKLEPHISGFSFFHELRHILVSDPSGYLKNKFGLLRDNAESYSLINDINNELLAHQFADGSPFGTIGKIKTNNGSTYPSNYAHTASGVFLNTNRFNTIPQTMNDLQLFADFIDSSSIFLLGSRIQNLYSNGISKISRSSSLTADGYGQALVQTVPAVAYLLSTGTMSSPFDDIDKGDDIVELLPPAGLLSSNSFDAQFALVKIGDVIRVNYGTVEVPFLIKEKKYIQNGLIKKFLIRINGKNLQYTANATARIDRSLVNPNKYGVLAVAPANNSFSEIPSLIIGSPRGAEVLGVWFDPDQLDSSHYNLYLAIYPTGNPSDGYTILPAIDITGNQGTTPGKYTIDYIVNTTNNAFRVPGFNYRFIAFSYNGNFGIKLADSYNNAAFSILNAVVNPSDGSYDTSATRSNFPNNVVDVFAGSTGLIKDALGFGVTGANIASPPYMTSYGSPAAAVQATKLFVPLKRNNYYVNGAERDQLAPDIGQVIDGYGDVYWTATVTAINPVPAPSPSGHVEVTYSIPLDLSASNLKAGKTLVIQSLNKSGSLTDFGRFTIKSVTFSGCTPTPTTDVVVYDAIHATGLSPYATLPIGSSVALYFDSSSVSFNKENASDISLSNPPAFKRHIEVYITQDGKTFTHERARMNISGSTNTVNGTIPLYSHSELAKFNIIKVSPKLRGFQFGQIQKTTLTLSSYNDTTGVYTGWLTQWDGSLHTVYGQYTTGRKGEITRFYDSTGNDYIDFYVDPNDVLSSFTNQDIDIQLFPSLSLDDEVMMISTCQLNDVTNKITYLQDARQFGNTSEKDLSTSALNYISLPEKLLHMNGVISGFDLSASPFIVHNDQIHINGGKVLVDGKIIQMNDAKLAIPVLQEFYSGTYYSINWALCVNSKGEYQFQPLLDHDVALGTPNDPNRMMKVFNPNTGLSYFVDANTFSDIVNTRKDLTILYIVGATLTTSPLPAYVSFSMTTDARRYVNDADSNLPLKLTLAQSQGNFRNPLAIINWVKYNNSFNSFANFNGANSLTGTISSNTILDFGHSTIFEGENNAQLTFNALVTLGSNLTIRNMRVDFLKKLAILPSSKNLSFENCEIHLQVDTTPSGNIAIDLTNSENVSFKDCTIFVNYTVPADAGAVFKLGNNKDFRFEGNHVEVEFAYVDSQAPGTVFLINHQTEFDVPNSGIRITDSSFIGNFSQFLVNSANNLVLSRLSVTSTHDPNIGPDIYAADPANGLPNGFTYNPGDFVNSGRGYIYCNVASTITDITIDRVTFNYNPPLGSKFRLSFINFELPTNTSILSNVTITNCKFNNLNVSTNADDVAAAIAIINKAPVTIDGSQRPTVANVLIANNTCNRNQMILVTSQTDLTSTGNMLSGLIAQNVVIRDNICGTIGYWVSADTKFINIVPNSLNDKTSNLIIENNLCHLIATMDHTGHYWYPIKLINTLIGDRTVNKCVYASGHVTITKNRSNWIHAAITTTTDSSIQVVNNSLVAYDQAYLDNFNDNETGSYGFTGGYAYGYAITVASNIHQAASSSSDTDVPDSPCIITGNSIGAGYWYTTSITPITYLYKYGGIFSQGSCQISHNTVKGMDENVLSGIPANIGILVSGSNNIVTHNRIYRNGKTILAYVAFGTVDMPAWDGASSHGVITENFFDSPWITDIVHNDISELTVNITFLGTSNARRWIIERNINQTGYLSIPITNNAGLFGEFGFSTTTGYSPGAFFVTSAPGVDKVASDIIGLYKSPVLWIHDTDTPTVKILGWQENLDKYLPANVRIVKLQMGLRPWESIVDINHANTLFYLSLNRYSVSNLYVDLDYFTGLPSGLPPYGSGIRDAGITNDLSPVAVMVDGRQINSTSLTIPMVLDTTTAGPGGTDISDQFTTNRFQSIGVTLDIRYLRNPVVGTDFYISPLMVKYRW
jgi:hypothetical protein